MKQAQALEILKTGRNVFVTGPAGSGKTYVINKYISFLRQNKIDVGITASTGIAATHMGGVTIHSWAGIGISSYLSEDDLYNLSEKSYLAKRFENVKVLIIDEVSMLHHFRFDLVDQVLRSVKKVNDPFGGIQVVLCGDFFQLPPVSRFGEPDTHFIYKSNAWKDGDFTICYLDEQFRQSDSDASNLILNEIRSGDVSEKAVHLLKTRMYDMINKEVGAEAGIAKDKKGIDEISIISKTESTLLFTHNADVDSINLSELGKLKINDSTEKADYIMEAKGKPFIVETLKKSCLAPALLSLKVGARVMCVKNNFEQGYVNGTLGTVVSCKPNQDPIIKLTSGRRITIEKATWKIEEDGAVKAEIRQYPLRLAWAITVHKSQGMSLDAVTVDLSKSFEPGMGYVALSRVRSLQGLTILGINDMALKVNNEVLEFDENLRELSKKAENMLLQKPEIIKKEQEDFLKYCVPEDEDHEVDSDMDVFDNDFEAGQGEAFGGIDSINRNGFKNSSNTKGKTKRIAKNKKAKIKEKKIPSHEETLKLIEEGKSLDEMAKARDFTTETIIKHIEIIMEEASLGLRPKPDISYLRKEISQSHWVKINNVFDEMLEEEEKAQERRQEEESKKETEKLDDTEKVSGAKELDAGTFGIYLSPAKQKLGPNISFLHIRLARVIRGLVPKSLGEVGVGSENKKVD